MSGLCSWVLNEMQSLSSFMFMLTHTHAHTEACTHTHMHTHTCRHAHTHARMHGCMCACVCVCVCVCMCVCVHMHAYCRDAHISIDLYCFTWLCIQFIAVVYICLCRIINNMEWYQGKSVVQFLSTVGRHFRMGPMLAKHRWGLA